MYKDALVIECHGNMSGAAYYFHGSHDYLKAMIAESGVLHVMLRETGESFGVEFSYSGDYYVRWRGEEA